MKEPRLYAANVDKPSFHHYNTLASALAERLPGQLYAIPASPTEGDGHLSPADRAVK